MVDECERRITILSCKSNFKEGPWYIENPTFEHQTTSLNQLALHAYHDNKSEDVNVTQIYKNYLPRIPLIKATPDQ